MFGDDTLEFNSCKGAASGYNNFTFENTFHFLDPGGVTIYLVENHLLVVPFSGGIRELSRLVGEHCLSWIVGFDINIFSFFNWR